MSQWEDLEMDAKIMDILDVHPYEPRHHLGRPFFTAYQIAISFKKRFKTSFDTIGLPVGGLGTGQHNSLAQYIARELSGHIKKHGESSKIEGGFLSLDSLLTLQFEKVDGKEVEASLSYDLSVFRRKD